MDNDTGTLADGRTAVAGAPGPEMDMGLDTGLDTGPCRTAPSGRTGPGNRGGQAARVPLAPAG